MTVCRENVKLELIFVKYPYTCQVRRLIFLHAIPNLIRN